MKHIFLLAVTILCIAVIAHAESPSADTPFSVRGFGAVGDGKTLDTAAVQKAIEACAAAGGGTVFFPASVYLCGSLHLRSGVTLYIDNGATIKASPNNEDFDPIESLGFKNDSDVETSFFHNALIWGEDVERIGIVGHGTIDGNRVKRHGPKNIALKRCKDVVIEGVRLLNCPNYNISMIGTDFVNIDGVTILNGYADGIDPDACRNVRISNCHIETRDDAIVPKASFSLGERRGCENITVTNCYLATDCYCFKLGTESGGDFKRIAVSNCVMTGFNEMEPASGGIALESVDGANIDGVVISNITMNRVQSPIFLRLGNRGRDMATPTPGSLKNVSISNVVAQDAGLACIISGIPGHNIEGVTLSDIRVLYRGGAMFRPLDEPVPEHIAEYPNPDMFGALPAYGLYCRHTANITLTNVQFLAKPGFWRQTVENDRDLDWSTNPPGGAHPSPLGPALVFDDVTGLAIHAIETQASDKDYPVLQFINVRDAFVQGNRAPANTHVYLDIRGDQTDQIVLTGNSLQEAKKAVSAGPEVPQKVVRRLQQETPAI